MFSIQFPSIEEIESCTVREHYFNLSTFERSISQSVDMLRDILAIFLVNLVMDDLSILI